jgi:hypothetical protein
VTGAAFVGHNLWVDASPIIANSHSKLALIIVDIHFDPTRPCVDECVTKRLANNPEDIVPQDRVEIAQCSFYLYANDRGILLRPIRRKLCRERVQSHREIVGLNRGRT